MSKIHFKGPLTFAKDSKNAKGFISMQIVTKIRILSEKLLYYYRITAKSWKLKYLLQFSIETNIFAVFKSFANASGPMEIFFDISEKF